VHTAIWQSCAQVLEKVLPPVLKHIASIFWVGLSDQLWFLLAEISLIPLIKIFATDLLFCLADLIHWGFLDAFQLYV
jgi:hypothetical protein